MKADGAASPPSMWPTVGLGLHAWLWGHLCVRNGFSVIRGWEAPTDGAA